MADQTISQLTELDGAALAANDLLPVVDTSSSETKKIKAAAFVQNGIALTASGNIDLSKLNQNSTVKINSVAIANGAITAIKLADDSSIAEQSSAPVVDNFAGRGWYSTVNGNLQIYSTGSYRQVVMPTAGLADQAVTNSKVADGAITTNKIDPSGITTVGIANSAITTAKVEDSAITSAKIADGTIVNTDIAASTIDGSRLANEAVGTAALAASGITSAKFSAGAVDNSALGTNAVTNEKISEATIAYSKLNLADGSVPGPKITSATISGLQLAAGGVLTANLADSAVINSKIAASGIEAGRLAADAVTTATIADAAVTSTKVANGAIGQAQIADDSITGAKIADNSLSIVDAADPGGLGAFVGQKWFNDSTKVEYTWDGATWERQAAIGTISFVDSTPLSFAVAYPDNYSATITTTLDAQNPNLIFAGPVSGVAAPPSFRGIVSTDLPVAATALPGAVSPGAGLSVDANGVMNHTNVAAAGTYTGPVTIDGQGHIVSAQTALQASDIPALDASKITTGTFDSAFLAENSVTASQLADYGIAQVSESAPTPEFAGQWWINPNDRSAYIWVGEVAPVPNGYWLNLGYGSPTQINLRFGGTYNASGNVVESINSYGIEAGLTIGQQLSSPNTSNNGVYLIVTSSGVGTTPAPTENLTIGNWVLSQGVGANWTKVNLASAVAGVGDQDVLVDGGSLIPVASGVATQEDLNTLVWARVQVATASTAGIVRASSTITVASGTGIMNVGIVDDGFYA
jgi:hypothetical protein